MAFANSSWTDVIASTIEYRGPQIADSVENNNPLTWYLKRKGKIKPVSGGTSIVEPLAFAENSNFAWYSGYDIIPVGPSDVLSAAQYAWKLCACAVTISGQEMLMNRGKEAMFDLIEARVDVAESTMKNRVEDGLWSDGTGNGGKEITGLDAAVPQDPTTGTYGGIDRATQTFWRSALYDPSSTPTTSTIQTYMQTLWATMVRGADRPDLIIAGATIWGTFLGSLTTMQNFTNTDVAKAGFTSATFNGADVILGGGIGTSANQITATDMLFLNTKYISFRPHRDRNMVSITPNRRVSVNQDAEVQILGWMGNLTTSAARMQGRLKGD